MVGLQTEPTAFERRSYYLQFPREGVCQAFRATWEVPGLVNREEGWASMAWCLYRGLPGKGKVEQEIILDCLVWTVSVVSGYMIVLVVQRLVLGWLKPGKMLTHMWSSIKEEVGDMDLALKGVLPRVCLGLSSPGSGMLPWWLSGKESTCQCRRCGFDPWVGKIPWRRKWQPVLCLGNAMDRGACGLQSVGLQSHTHLSDKTRTEGALCPASQPLVYQNIIKCRKKTDCYTDIYVCCM